MHNNNNNICHRRHREVFVCTRIVIIISNHVRAAAFSSPVG